MSGPLDTVLAIAKVAACSPADWIRPREWEILVLRHIVRHFAELDEGLDLGRWTIEEAGQNVSQDVYEGLASSGIVVGNLYRLNLRTPGDEHCPPAVDSALVRVVSVWGDEVGARFIYDGDEGGTVSHFMASRLTEVPQ